MSRRKDRERFLRLKEQNPDYVGFRGGDTAAVTAAAAPQLVMAVCSVCQRRRNVPEASLPEDRDTFVCLQCQESQAAANPEGSGE
ncbi:MAG: hypothetical protein ACE5Q6_20455 [Dehalococcoidia bacterium]